MSYWPTRDGVFVTTYTILAAAVGAGLAYALSFPVHLLTGPALFLSVLAAMGVRFEIAAPARDCAFLLIGVGVGAGVDDQATDAMARWPAAFVVLAVMLVAALFASRFVLTRFFGFDRRSAVLAAAPGHLSFVIGLGESLGMDMVRIAVVQSVRLLALTLVVPFVAAAFGVAIEAGLTSAGPVMPPLHVALVFAASIALGLVLMRAGAPAPLLIGAMVASSAAHLTGLTPGALSPELAMIGFLIVGALIGARFSGVGFSEVRAALLAGVAATSITVALALLAALPVAWLLAMPTAHVIVGFAPGGLETMIAMGAVIGANPGFIAACHVGRLLLLTFLIPAAMLQLKKEA